MPAKWAALNEVGPGGVFSHVVPDMDRKWYDKFAELAHENPIYQRWVRTQDGRAYRFSDVTTPEELQRTRLWKEFYEVVGIRHQIAFTLPNEPSRVLALVLVREDRDFSDAERDFLNRARPYLIQAYRNAIAYSLRAGRGTNGMEAALVDAGLSGRQAAVVRLVALGNSNRDVAARLGVSDRTVQKHLEHAFRKLGVRSRSAAASRAWELTGE